MEKHIALLCNPTLDNARALLAANDLAVLLTAKEIRHDVFTAAWPTAWAGFTEAWVVGGDGTLNYFINQYPDFNLPITIFKGGSGNDFHWMLYGNVTLEEQALKVMSGSTAYVDTGVCNGQLFLNGVGIGFDGAIVKDLVGKKKLAGKASYLLSILKQIALYKEQPYEITSATQQLKGDCFLISVANGRRYGGGFMVAPNAAIKDGLLDLNVVGRIAPLKRLQLLPVIERGEHLQLPFVRHEQTGTVLITTPQPVPAHIDGEYLFANQFEIRCLPKKFIFFV